ncbi:MAG: tetratricopeptide repeat protein [Proteobacteria bacterium]|nr:tetratricopeptide repeat protein [Pseudomonadota bacterium]
MSGATDPDQTGYQVDDLILDVGQQRLTRAGVEIPLPRLSFDLLLALARAAPNLLTFDQLTERVWPGLVITPETISQRVKLVRASLGDNPHAPRYIGGVRGRGYRMVARVHPLADPSHPQRAAPAPAELPAPVPAGPPDARPGPPPAAAGPRLPRLPWWAAAAMLLLMLIVLPWWWSHTLHPPHSVAVQRAADAVVVQPPRTVAVLPLADMSPGGGNSYLGDGLAQELSARLARIRNLRVASRTSVASFKDRNVDVHTIAQRLGVRHVLEGSVLREGDQLRVTATLIDASTGFNVWSHTYNRPWQDLLVIEDDIARAITRSLEVVLTSELAQPSGQQSGTHLAAFELYLQGLAELYGPAGTAHREQAGESFKRALALDPNFALAYAGLCERYVQGYESTRDASLVPQAESACARALNLDGSLSEVNRALAGLYNLSGRHGRAEAIYREGIRSDPDNADNYIGLAEALEGQHRGAEAERALRQAVEVEPTYWEAHNALGGFLFNHGRTAAAVSSYRRVAQLTPLAPLAFNNVGAALEMGGDFQAAAAAFERSLALEPTRSAYSNLGTVYYFLGRQADAARSYTKASELAPEDHRVWGNLADAQWQTEGARAQAQENYRRAAELAQRGLEVNPQDAVSWMQLAYYRTRAGDGTHAERYSARALALAAKDPTVQYYAALIALQHGDRGGALEALARAVEFGYPPQLVSAAPDFASLRGEPRFRRLIAPAKSSQV